jgi:hypothetical protein
MKASINKNFIFITIAIFSLSYEISAITLLYNLKVRRAFGLGDTALVVGKEKKSRWIATAVPIVYKRDRHIVDNRLGIDVCEKRIVGGSILNLRYVSSKSWWLEATTSVQREHGTSRGTTTFKASRTGFDDVIIEAGYNMMPTKDSQFVLYGLAGFPTRRKVTLLDTYDPFVGTRFFGLGVGSEISYSFINTLKKSFMALVQARFLHFFNRRWFPILPCNAKIQPGNTIDLLFTLQYRKGKNIFETGYNPIFFTNQAALLKTGKIKAKNYVRQSVYASFAHVFPKVPLVKKPLIVEAGFSLARADRFHVKIVVGWLSISLVF